MILSSAELEGDSFVLDLAKSLARTSEHGLNWLAGIAGRLVGRGRYTQTRAALSIIEKHGAPVDPATGVDVDIAVQSRVLVAVVGDSSMIPHTQKKVRTRDFRPSQALKTAATVARFGLQGDPLSTHKMDTREFVLGGGTASTIIPQVEAAGEWFASVEEAERGPKGLAMAQQTATLIRGATPDAGRKSSPEARVEPKEKGSAEGREASAPEAVRKDSPRLEEGSPARRRSAPSSWHGAPMTSGAGAAR